MIETLVLATTNPGKLERLRWVFGGLGLELYSLPESAGVAPDEDGRSFRENAEIKASYWSKQLGRPAAASDGGMTIPALGDRHNALRTARAAGPNATDQVRAKFLLRLCSGLKGDERAVYWSEGLALAQDGELLGSWASSGSRAVLLESIPTGGLRPGLWADSLCWIPELNATRASLAADELDRLDPTWSSLRREVRRYFQDGRL